MAKILVVDDAQFLRVRLTRMLEEHGHDIVEAENGVHALDQYDSHKPDVVLLDITMPEKDGLEVLKEIRNKDPEAKIVMLTALGQQSIVLEAIKSGAKDFIVKPFEQDRVLAALKKIV